MAKTVVIIASPRNGNSKELALKIAEGAKANGNEIETFELNKLANAKGCQACMGCKKAGHCVQKDDQTPILEAIMAADSIVLSTPTYFSQSVSQFRRLEDRFFGFLAGDFSSYLPAGKKVAIVVTCGSGLDDAKQIAKSLEMEWGNFFKAEIVGSIVAGDMMPPNAAAGNADLQKQALDIGKKL